MFSSVAECLLPVRALESGNDDFALLNLGKTQEVNVSESGEMQSLKSARAWTQLLACSLTDL
jgi:hypothetical protein